MDSGEVLDGLDITTMYPSFHSNPNNTLFHSDQIMAEPRRYCNSSFELPGTGGCINLLYIVSDYYASIINGYIMPPLVLFTMVTNGLLCAVLMSPRMRSPSNTILVAMALSDMLTGAWTLPPYLYFYTLGGQEDYMPYKWCLTYYWLTDYLPTTFHTASVWLTVALAAQRYVFICHNTRFKHLFSICNMLKVVVGIFVASFLTQLVRAGENRFEPITLRSRHNPDEYFVGCSHVMLPDFTEQETQIYFSVMFWFRFIFVHMVPCVSLVALNVALTVAMHAALVRMRRLVQRQSCRGECRRLQETNATTLLLIVVVALFLLVELPLAFFIVTMVIENTYTSKTPLIDLETRHTAELFLNLLVLLSYPLNFFIYCGMSRQFRESFTEICGFGSSAKSRGSSAIGGESDPERSSSGRKKKGVSMRLKAVFGKSTGKSQLITTESQVNDDDRTKETKM